MTQQTMGFIVAGGMCIVDFRLPHPPDKFFLGAECSIFCVLNSYSIFEYHVILTIFMMFLSFSVLRKLSKGTMRI